MYEAQAVSFSVLIITQGREELLLKCLASLRPPVSDWQLILVANGVALSESVLTLAKSLTAQVEVITLEAPVLAGKARNEGLKVASGDWVFFIDDDAYVSNNYFSLVLPYLEKPEIDVLGGPDLAAPGMTPFSDALAIALASPFCTGTTYNRHKVVGTKLTKAQEENLTSCNLWVRRAVLETHSFPENYLRTEEISLLGDLHAAGAKLYQLPTLYVFHHRRKRLRDLWTPTFYAGYFRSRLMKEKPHMKRDVFWYPSIFVLLHLVLFIEPYSFITLARIYATLVFALSLALCARRKKLGLTLRVAFLHWFIVFNYGLGFLAERLKIPCNIQKK